MNATLDFKLFKKDDFAEYLSWFQDPSLNAFLGPMEENDEWLTHILKELNEETEDRGCTYSVFSNANLVAVVGVAFPTSKFPCYLLTSIAVKPDLRKRGFGKLVLNTIIDLLPTKEGQNWQAQVDEKNIIAKSFFENSGWKTVIEPSDKDGMYLLEYRYS